MKQNIELKKLDMQHEIIMTDKRHKFSLKFGFMICLSIMVFVLSIGLLWSAASITKLIGATILVGIAALILNLATRSFGLA